MLKVRPLYILLFSAVIALTLNAGVYAQAPQLDRSDPAAVANAFLEALHVENYSFIIDLMPKAQMEEYRTIAANNPTDINRIFGKDKEKAGKKTRVTELRKMTTFSGTPGIAAKVWKKGKEVYVIILSKEGDKYCYENSLTVTSKLYKDLTFIQKVK